MKHRGGLTLLTIIWLAVALLPLYYGWNYYTTPFQERAYHPDYNLFRPAGLVGHGLGVVGSLMMIVGVSMYSLRKRWAFLRRLGQLRVWLTLHIFLCTLGPFLVLLHTAFQFQGLVAISFWSMVIVVASGVLGRYIYRWIPKNEEGEFWSMDRLRTEQNTAQQQLTHLLGDREHLSGIEINQKTSIPVMVYRAVGFDLVRIFLHSRWNNLAREAGLDAESRDKGWHHYLRWYRLQQQKILLKPFEQLFTYWHVFHIPLAGLMFLILAVHIFVAVLFGHLWIF